MTWRDEAACRGSNPDVFFPEVGHRGVVQARIAKAICGGCPVSTECLEDALRFPAASQAGIRGGLTPRQRQEMRGRRRGHRGRRLGSDIPDNAVVRRAAGVAASLFDVPVEDLFGPGRPRGVVLARRWMWWLLIERDGWSAHRTGVKTGFESTSITRSVREAQKQVREGTFPAEVEGLVMVDGKGSGKCPPSAMTEEREAS